eukprot:g6374.t1
MKLELGTTSIVAALFSTTFASNLIITRDRNRQRSVICRSQLPYNLRWIRRLNSSVNHGQGPSLIEINNVSSSSAERPPPIGIQNCKLLSFIHQFWCLLVLAGVLISGLTALVLNLTGVIDCIKDSIPSRSNEISQSASINRYSSIDETLRKKLRHFEVQIDQLAEDIQNESPDLTKEDIDIKQQLIKEVWETVNLHYYNTRDLNFSKEKWAKLRDEALLKQPKTKNSTYKIIRSMLERGLNDPYARITPKEEFSKMVKYDMTGVGLNVGSGTDFIQRTQKKPPGIGKNNPEGIWVLGLIKGSVSDLAGVSIGDQILEVDGTSVNGSSPFQTAMMIKGSSNQPKVVLKIRKKEGDLEEVSLNRSTTKVAPAVKTSIERVVGMRKVGRIKVVSCTAQSRDEVLEAIHELSSKNVKEIILDLRENRGGLVQEGVEIAKLFLDEGSTVMISRQSSDFYDTRFFADEPAKSDARLIVQVGQETASAAEIIAGALKDNCRGVVVGDRTYGKGLIQSVYALSDGSGLTLTVGQYLTPNMTNIDQTGIEPDFKKIPRQKRADESLKGCKVQRPQYISKTRK